MSEETAKALGILPIALGINSVKSDAHLKWEFEPVSEGLQSYKAVKLNRQSTLR